MSLTSDTFRFYLVTRTRLLAPRRCKGVRSVLSSTFPVRFVLKSLSVVALHTEHGKINQPCKLTRARLWFISWNSWMHSSSLCLVSLTYILILSSYLCNISKFVSSLRVFWLEFIIHLLSLPCVWLVLLFYISFNLLYKKFQF